jgi:hypothetical protein
MAEQTPPTNPTFPARNFKKIEETDNEQCLHFLNARTLNEFQFENCQFSPKLSTIQIVGIYSVDMYFKTRKNDGEGELLQLSP